MKAKSLDSPLRASALNVAHRVYCRYMPKLTDSELAKMKPAQIEREIMTELEATVKFAGALVEFSLKHTD